MIRLNDPLDIAERNPAGLPHGVSVEEAAFCADVSEVRVRQLCRSGALRAVQLRSPLRWVIDPWSLRDWIDRRFYDNLTMILSPYKHVKIMLELAVDGLVESDEPAFRFIAEPIQAWELMRRVIVNRHRYWADFLLDNYYGPDAQPEDNPTFWAEFYLDPEPAERACQVRIIRANLERLYGWGDERAVAALR